MKIVKFVFGLVGVVFMGVGYFWYSSTADFVDEAVHTTGTVTELVLRRTSDSRAYHPAITFVDRQGESISFISNTGSSSPDYSKGDIIDILYLANKPQNAKINGFFSLWGGSLIFGGLGSIFFLISVGLVIYPIMKKRKDQHLQNTGTPIKTEFQRVELNESYSVNGRHPFQLVTQWQNPSSSQIHVFRSNNLWFDPTDYVNRDHITVFIEKDDPETYYMDISFLPELAE